MPTTGARVLGPQDGKAGDLASIGVRFMVDGDEAGGGFSLVEHPCRRARWPHRFTATAARTSTASCSRAASVRCSATRSSTRNRATSSSSPATSGTPWGDEPARILEIISPAGFERYFEELVALPSEGPPDRAQIAAIAARYGLELDFQSMPGLLEEHGLRFGSAAR